MLPRYLFIWDSLFLLSNRLNYSLIYRGSVWSLLLPTLSLQQLNLMGLAYYSLTPDLTAFIKTLSICNLHSDGLVAAANVFNPDKINWNYFHSSNFKLLGYGNYNMLYHANAMILAAIVVMGIDGLMFFVSMTIKKMVKKQTEERRVSPKLLRLQKICENAT